MRRRAPAQQLPVGVVLALLTALASLWLVHPAAPHASQHPADPVPVSSSWDGPGPLTAIAGDHRVGTATAATPSGSWEQSLAAAVHPHHADRAAPVWRGPGDPHPSTDLLRASTGQERAPPAEPIS